jgi:hypothetical protein
MLSITVHALYHGADKLMGYTHKLAEAQMKVINLLKMMPSVME